MIKYTPKHQVKVGGKMSKEGADKVGNKLANAVLILATCLGISALMIAYSYLM
ncbi:hypothetical protein Q7469_12425 [Glaesserella parasuis]|uniref:hypothetical protein n=1 Tax=Glaesserella parasuis TaxID=738 RepID=UPI000A98EB59|nr:hypothetical protein [Glaesserella parasuis]MDG6318741.1 hypothetical protein [Glaesserella parasuis]MDG6363856.1 hypothetical protein [Glaesserella parasuis]MDG6449292.1 hypothetical protein [Glaesserella parasuis]MDG6829084.1 hypothetical protein [Glaesserella parasuis]MDG6843249.1 hypothetical protein [Glaesserella parasuis]